LLRGSKRKRDRALYHNIRFLLFATALNKKYRPYRAFTLTPVSSASFRRSHLERIRGMTVGLKPREKFSFF
jgi:hypothetical protein